MAHPSYQQLAADPAAPRDVFMAWGGSLMADGSPREAVAAFREGIRRFPDDAGLLNGCGLARHAMGAYEEAARDFEAALRHAPRTGVIAYNLGNARKEQGDLPGAATAYVQALEWGPPAPHMFNNLGLVFQETGDTERACLAFRSALELDDRFVPASLNLGYLLIHLREPARAAGVLEAALSHEPANADAHWLLSHALLVMGDLQRGWREYEWRWAKMTQASYRRKDPSRQWAGEPLEGKRILLYAEQGLGDAIQCARYIPMVAAAGGEVHVECQPELAAVMASVEGVHVVHTRGSVVPPCDRECPLMSLPGVFGTTLDAVPAAVPYVRTESVKRAAWRSWCDAGSDGPRVGIVWAGNPAHANDAQRSLPSAHLGALTAVPGVEWIGLQKGVGADPRLHVPEGVRLRDAGPELRDLGDTAALLTQLDLVVTVDTAVAHLAGALGVPVWILVPYAPDWRWLLEGGTTPWYPTARLYRQPAPQDWNAVIARVRTDLAHLVAAH